MGDVSTDNVGSIMLHEHILFDISVPTKNTTNSAQVTIEDRWQIDYLSNENPENSCQKELSIAVNELNFFRQDGGSLIVDQSVFGLDRNPVHCYLCLHHPFSSIKMLLQLVLVQQVLHLGQQQLKQLRLQQ